MKRDFFNVDTFLDYAVKSSLEVIQVDINIYKAFKDTRPFGYYERDHGFICDTAEEFLLAASQNNITV